MNQSSKIADVETVTTHEMGHWMFLGEDCSDTSSVRCPNYVAKWYLSSDDLAGLEVLYP